MISDAQPIIDLCQPSVASKKEVEVRFVLSLKRTWLFGQYPVTGLLLCNAPSAIVLIRVFKRYMFKRRYFVVVVIRDRDICA